MSHFNSFLGGLKDGRTALQRRQSDFNAAIMAERARAEQKPMGAEATSNSGQVQNTRASYGSGDRGEVPLAMSRSGAENLAEAFAGLDPAKRIELKAELNRKGQILAALKPRPTEEQVIGIQTFGPEFGFDNAAVRKAASNPAMALAEVSSSIQQAEAMLEQVSLIRRASDTHGSENLLGGNQIGIGGVETPAFWIAQAAQGPVKVSNIPRDDAIKLPPNVLETDSKAEQMGEVSVRGASEKTSTPVRGKFTVDESIQSLTEEIENTEVMARRRTISDAYAEKRLEQYGGLANLKLQKYLREKGIDILNADELGVDKLYPTHPSQNGKSYINLSGKESDFELPGAIGRYYPKAKGRSNVIVNLPLGRAGHPELSDSYLSKDSSYLNGGSRQDASLNLGILSDLYTDGNGNYYRGYAVRTWIGKEPELWSLGRSNIADLKSAEYARAGDYRIRDFRDSNTSAVDIVDLDVITPITPFDLSKIKAGIDEAQTGFDRVGNIYVRKGN